MSNFKLNSLGVPPAVVDSASNQELVRFWIADGDAHVSMKFGVQGTQDDDAYQWGRMLADLMLHFINANLDNNPNGMDGSALFKTINEGLMDGLSHPPDLEGKVEKPNAH